MGISIYMGLFFTAMTPTSSTGLLKIWYNYIDLVTPYRDRGEYSMYGGDPLYM